MKVVLCRLFLFLIIIICQVKHKSIKTHLSFNSCTNLHIKTLTVENYPYLKELVIGDECFGYVNTVKIKDDVSLESIMIGKNSFTLNKNSYGENTGRSFTLTNCHNLHSVTIGRFSFSDYNSCNLSCMNEEMMRIMNRLV